MTKSGRTIWSSKRAVRNQGDCDLQSSASRLSRFLRVKPRGRRWRHLGTVSAAVRAFILLVPLLLALPTLLLSPPARAHDNFHGPFHVTTMNTEGWTDLHHAAYGGHREAIEELISAGAEVNARNGSDRTPLHAPAVLTA